MASSQGRLIADQYRIIEEVGRGGFGVVWRAHDERLHRDVAVKELFLPSYLATGQQRERRERSLREARSAARIDHPAAVTVYDVVEHEGSPWIIMEFVDGRALNAIVKAEGPLPPPRVAEIGRQLLGALRAAHAAGVVHRDVKPANVLIGDRRVVLTDFGIATIDGDSTLTHSGFIMGAPAYTAPERARGEPAVTASDLWSLGATLFYAVEGYRPYPGGNANAVLHAVLNSAPPMPRSAGPLTPVIQGLLRKDVTERLTADEAARMLEEILRSGQAGPAGQAGASGDARLRHSDSVSPVRRLLTARAGRRTFAARLRHPDSVPPVRRLLTGRAGRRTFAFAGVGMAATIALVISLWPPAARTQPSELPGASPREPSGNNNARAAAKQPRLLATLPGVEDEVDTVAFSPDGKVLAAGGEGSVVRLWNVADRRPVAVLRGHDHAVFTIAFSPDGTTLATGGYDKTVILWDVTTHRRLATLSPDQGTINMVAFSPDGKELVTAGTDAVQLWNVADRRPLKTVSRPGERQFTTAFGSRAQLGIASTDTIRLREPGRPPKTTTVTRPTSLIRAMAFSPDGKIMACAGDNGRVALWETATVRRVAVLGHDRGVNAVGFSPDGRILATASGPSVALWNVTTHQRITTVTGFAGTVSSVAFNPRGRMLATGGYDKTVQLWSLGSERHEW